MTTLTATATPTTDIERYLNAYGIHELQFSFDCDGFEATAYSEDDAFISIPEDEDEGCVPGLTLYFIQEAIQDYISERNDYRSIAAGGNLSLNAQGALTFTGTVTLNCTY